MDASLNVTETGTIPFLVFISYAHGDRTFCLRLKRELHRLTLDGSIELWTDKDIQGGENWHARIWAMLRNANMVLLLISREFSGSHDCMQELEFALVERGKDAALIPVPLTPRGWEECKGRLGHLQAIPSLPVSEWPNDDEALAAIVTHVESLIAGAAPMPLGRLGPEVPLLVSPRDGLIGGAVGGAIAGLCIAAGYWRENRSGLALLVAAVLFVGLAGTLLGLCIPFSVLRFRRVRIRKRWPRLVFNEVVGGMVGGALCFLLVGAVAGAIFVRYGQDVVNSNLVMESALLGSIVIPIAILNKSDRGSRDVTILLSILVACAALTIMYAVQQLHLIKLERYCDGRPLCPCTLGSSFYLSCLGAILGLCIGLSLFVHRRLRQARAYWASQNAAER